VPREQCPLMWDFIEKGQIFVSDGKVAANLEVEEESAKKEYSIAGVRLSMPS
jgi:hypothetical protein